MDPSHGTNSGQPSQSQLDQPQTNGVGSPAPDEQARPRDLGSLAIGGTIGGLLAAKALKGAVGSGAKAAVPAAAGYLVKRMRESREASEAQNRKASPPPQTEVALPDQGPANGVPAPSNGMPVGEPINGASTEMPTHPISAEVSGDETAPRIPASNQTEQPRVETSSRNFEVEVSEAEDEMEEALFLISEGDPAEEAKTVEPDRPSGGLFEEPDSSDANDYELASGTETISKPARSPFLRDHTGDPVSTPVDPVEEIGSTEESVDETASPTNGNPFQIAPPPSESPTVVPESTEIAPSIQLESQAPAPAPPPSQISIPAPPEPQTLIPGPPADIPNGSGSNGTQLPPPGALLPPLLPPAGVSTEIPGPPPPTSAENPPPAAEVPAPPSLFGQNPLQTEPGASGALPQSEPILPPIPEPAPVSEDKPPLAQLPGIAPATGLPPAPENKKTILPPPRTQVPPAPEPESSEPPPAFPPANDAPAIGLPGLPPPGSVPPPAAGDNVFSPATPSAAAAPPTPVESEPAEIPPPPPGPAPLAQMVPAPQPGLTPAEIAAKERADKLAQKKRDKQAELPPRRKLEAQNLPMSEPKGKKTKGKKTKPKKQTNRQPKQPGEKSKLLLFGAPVAALLVAAGVFGFFNKEKLGFGSTPEVADTDSATLAPAEEKDPIEREHVLGTGKDTSFTVHPIPGPDGSPDAGPDILDEPPAALPMTEQEKVEISKDPRRTLEAFLLSGTIEDLLSFVADRDIVEPDIRAYYKDKGGVRTPIANRQITEDKSGIVPGTNKRAYMFWVTTSRRRIPVSVEETDDGYKVDWAAFTQFHDSIFEGFIRNARSPAGGFYVELRRSHFFGNSVPDQEKLHAFRVRSPIAPFPESYAFLRKDNPMTQSILERYPWNKENRPFVELKWVTPEVGAEPRIEIQRIVRYAWRR